MVVSMYGGQRVLTPFIYVHDYMTLAIYVHRCNSGDGRKLYYGHK